MEHSKLWSICLVWLNLCMLGISEKLKLSAYLSVDSVSLPAPPPSSGNLSSSPPTPETYSTTHWPPHPDTNSVEYTPSFNPIALKDSALSTHKPIEVKGPGGKATIVHAQYNTPISMYSQDAIMDAIAGQSQAKGHDRWGQTTVLIPSRSCLCTLSTGAFTAFATNITIVYLNFVSIFPTT